eukprot:GHVS01012295.1.p1 GENE.GHVS01012295.1~~GHVS01012295.1.p1  ORF type:complete len:494 (+),score=58.72 GHVS01012295.1:120-1484(+)
MPLSGNILRDYPYAKSSLKLGHFGEDTRVKVKIYSLKWTANGDRLVVASRENILVTNPYTLSTESTIPTPAVGVLPHPCNPDILAALCYDKPVVKFFDLRTSSSAPVLTSSKLPVASSSAAAKPKGLLASGGGGPTEMSEIRTQTNSLISGVWRRDGRLMVVSDRQDTIQSLDLRVNANTVTSSSSPNTDGLPLLRTEMGGINAIGGELGVKCRYGTEVGMMCFDSYGELLIVTRQDGIVDVFPGNPLSLKQEEKISLPVHHGYVYSAACDPSGDFLATGGIDQTVNLIDIDSLSSVGTISRIEGTVSCLSFSHSGEWLAWGSKDSSPAGAAPQMQQGGGGGGPMGGGAEQRGGGSDASGKGEWGVFISGVRPLEVYRSFVQPAPIASVSWHPSRDILAFACDSTTTPSTSAPSNEYFMTGSSTNEPWYASSGTFWSSSNKVPKQHPIGILTIE